MTKEFWTQTGHRGAGNKTFCVAVLTAALVLSVSYRAWGQNTITSGTITGIITDTTGAALPDAAVTATNVATEVRTKTETNSVGSFTIPNLKIGTYTVRVEHAGFAPRETSGVLLDPNSVVRVDATLAVGNTSQTVNVTEQAPLLETQQVTLDQTIDREFIAALPNVVSGGIRDIVSLLNLTPGAVQGGDSFQASVAGGRSFQFELLLDGVPMIYTPLSSVSYTDRPDQDTISEVQSQIGVPTAEWGHTSGAVASFITRSGTDMYHGDSLIILRNTLLDATPYNSKTKTQDQQYEWPTSIGGPITIPHFYNGHGRSFFFFNYSAYRTHSNSPPQVTTVPTANERMGDFSELPADQLIYDPDTGEPFAPIPSNPDCVNPGRCIPSSRFSSISSQFLAKFIPDPINSGLVNNYIGRTPSSDEENHYFAKIDQRIGDANIVHGTFRWDTVNSVVYESPFGVALGTYSSVTANRSLSIADDTILRPNLANSFSATYQRWFTTVSSTPASLFPVQIPGSYGSGFPEVNFAAPYGTGYGQLVAQAQWNPSWNINEALSWTKGKHNFKFGGRYTDYISYGVDNSSVMNGIYGFAPLESGDGQTGQGDAFASFLLGEVDSASLTTTSNLGYSTTYYAVYGQDDWRLSPKLTVNLGLRWDIQQPFNYPGASIVSQTALNPGAGDLPGAAIFTGANRTGTRFEPTWFGAVGPRVGLAWNPVSNLVVRGGYGIMYSPHEFALSRYTFSGTDLTSPAPGTPVIQWDAGFQPGQVVPYIPNNTNPALYNGTAVSTLDPTYGSSDRLPDTQLAQVDVQYSWKTVLLGAAWVGQYTHNISGVSSGGDQVNLAWINQLPVSDMKYGTLLTSSITDPAVVAAGFKPPYPGFSGTLAQALRPFPQYLDVHDVIPVGEINYNAMILRAEKRLANGLQFLASYTFSKTLSNVNTNNDFGLAAPQDQFNRQFERSVASSDIPRVLNLNYVYEFPIGNGRKYVNGGFLGRVFEGFSISGNQLYESGSPIMITAPADDLPIFNGYLSLNRGTGPFTTGNRGSTKIGNSLYGSTGTTYLNQAAFALPPDWTDPAVAANPYLALGNLKMILPNVRNLGFFNENLSLSRRQRFHERYTFQVGFDMLDAFNRRNYGGLNTTYGSANFGTYGAAANGPRVIQLNSKITF